MRRRYVLPPKGQYVTDKEFLNFNQYLFTGPVMVKGRELESLLFSAGSLVLQARIMEWEGMLAPAARTGKRHPMADAGARWQTVRNYW